MNKVEIMLRGGEEPLRYNIEMDEAQTDEMKKLLGIIADHRYSHGPLDVGESWKNDDAEYHLPNLFRIPHTNGELWISGLHSIISIYIMDS